jgi:hypothetical protein
MVFIRIPWTLYIYLVIFDLYCLGTGVRASGEFAHTYCTCQNCKIIGKVQTETTGMWGLTLIILKDIKCFQIWAYFEGIGINFNFENFQNKIFPLFILRTIQSMYAQCCNVRWYRAYILWMVLKMNKGKILFWKFSKLKFIPIPSK